MTDDWDIVRRGLRPPIRHQVRPARPKIKYRQGWTAHGRRVVKHKPKPIPAPPFSRVPRALTIARHDQRNTYSLDRTAWWFGVSEAALRRMAKSGRAPMPVGRNFDAPRWLVVELRIFNYWQRRQRDRKLHLAKLRQYLKAAGAHAYSCTITNLRRARIMRRAETMTLEAMGL